MGVTEKTKNRKMETARAALLLYFSDWILKGEVYDEAGVQIGKHCSMDCKAAVSVEDIVIFIRNIKEEYPDITAVSMGIPGAVHRNRIVHLPKFPELAGSELAERIEAELRLKVFLENDINAVAFFEAEDCKDFAHIVYVEEDDCIGVGIVINGKLVRGSQGYAGELEYLCNSMQNREGTFVNSIMALVCVLNLPDIFVSGEYCSKENIRLVEKRLRMILPAERIPKLHIVENMEEVYEKGLLKQVMGYWKKEA